MNVRFAPVTVTLEKVIAPPLPVVSVKLAPNRVSLVNVIVPPLLRLFDNVVAPRIELPAPLNVRLPVPATNMDVPKLRLFVNVRLAAIDNVPVAIDNVPLPKAPSLPTIAVPAVIVVPAEY